MEFHDEEKEEEEEEEDTLLSEEEEDDEKTVLVICPSEDKLIEEWNCDEVAGWLYSLKIPKKIILKFINLKIDGSILLFLNENDLKSKELNLSKIFLRKKILFNIDKLKKKQKDKKNSEQRQETYFFLKPMSQIFFVFFFSVDFFHLHVYQHHLHSLLVIQHQEDHIHKLVGINQLCLVVHFLLLRLKI